MLVRINRWYDAVQEPWRFVLFLGIVGPGMIAATVDHTPVKVAGFAWLGFLLFVRAGYIISKRRAP